MPQSEIADAFERTCRDRRSSPAIRWLPDQQTLTFQDLHDRHRGLVEALQRADIGEGDCVMAVVGNHPIFFPLVAACMAAGATLLPVGETTDAEAVAIVHNAGAAAVVATRPLGVQTIGQTPVDRDVSLFRLPAERSNRYGRSKIVKLTSGSTSLPKAALAGEASLLGDTLSITGGMGIGPTDVNLALIPLSHAYAISNIVVPLIVNGTGVALRSMFSPARFLADVDAGGVTVFPGVPFMFDRLRHTLGDRLPPGLRLLVTAGAPIDPDTVAWFHQHAGRKIHSFYGTSETGGITFDDTEALSDPLHVGRPLPGVTVELLPQPGVTQGGRVFVRAAGMADGYFSVPGPASEPVFVGGGFRTSDLGYLNDAGQLVLTGRISALVNVAGRKVDPSEVERVLVALPEVADARVVGVDCQTRGQELVAFVIRAEDSATPLALRRACAATLSPYKIPRRFIFLDRWPVNARGKVDRRELEALAGPANARELLRD